MQPTPELDPKAQQVQIAMMKLLSASPEPILDLLDRCGISWERVRNVPGDPNFDTLVIRWSDLREGEKRNQTQGPFIKKLFEEMKKEIETEFSDQMPVNPLLREGN